MHSGPLAVLVRKQQPYKEKALFERTALFFNIKGTLIALFFLFSTVLNSLAQHQYRIKTDFTVKTKVKGKPEGQLIIGSCYYDLNQGRLVYDIRFPEKEIWIIEDTTHWIIRNDTIVDRKSTQIKPELSVLHLSLQQALTHYGLKHSIYQISSVKNEGDLVITTWQPPAKARKKFGNIAISNKNKQLHGVIFYHPKGHVLRKQFFNKYIVINGLPFPSEVIDIVYEEDKEILQQTTYSNPMINERENNHFYNFIPSLLPSK